MNWTRLHLTRDDEIPSGLMLKLLQERFWNWYAPGALQRAAQAKTFPDDVAMFSISDAHTGVIEVYFTPNTAPLARCFDVEPCDVPAHPDLALTAGDASAWHLVRTAGTAARSIVEASLAGSAVATAGLPSPGSAPG